MRTVLTLHRLVFVALLAAGCLTLLPGCAGTDPENMAERPWNSPQGWENGLPGGMMQQGH